MKKIKICLIGNFISRYGRTPQLCEYFFSKFSKLGYEVIKGGYYKNRVLRVLDMVFVLIFKKKKYNFVLIDTFSGSAFWWAYFSGKIAKMLKKQYISILHGGNLPEFYKNHKKAVSTFLNNAKHIISPSSYLRKWALSQGFIVFEIPNPIDLRNYMFRKRKQIKPALYWVRRYHSIYNPEMAIQVLSKLKNEYPNCSLIMAGSDSGEKKICIKLAKKLNVLDHVIFKDKLTKRRINLIGQKRDIFINTTHLDNTPITLIEAAAMGLPIVSTNVGGIPDLFTDKKEALLVSDNNVTEMVEAINILLKTPNLVKSITTNAKKKVEKFDWENVKKIWEKLFEDISNG